MTLIEVLSVLMILSIVGVMLMVRDTGDSMRIHAEREIIKGHLRHVQYLALANDEHSWRLRFSGDAYTLLKGENDETMLPDESSGRHELMQGMALQVVREDGGIVDFIQFDRWGAPASGSAYTIRLSDLVNGGTLDIEIIENTGYVQ